MISVLPTLYGALATIMAVWHCSLKKCSQILIMIRVDLPERSMQEVQGSLKGRRSH